MRDEKIINQIIDYVKYKDTNVFDAILDISEQTGLDVEDIVKSLDENLLCELKAYSIKERKVLMKVNKQNTSNIESLFV